MPSIAMPVDLRDYFAGQALLGIVSFWQKFCEDSFDDLSLDEPQRRWHKRAAVQAYQYADALLEARETASQQETPQGRLSPQSSSQGRTGALSGQGEASDE